MGSHVFFFTPPHTPEHNGYVEHHHGPIREIVLTLLSQAGLQHKFFGHIALKLLST